MFLWLLLLLLFFVMQIYSSYLFIKFCIIKFFNGCFEKNSESHHYLLTKHKRKLNFLYFLTFPSLNQTKPKVIGVGQACSATACYQWNCQ